MPFPTNMFALLSAPFLLLCCLCPALAYDLRRASTIATELLSRATGSAPPTLSPVITPTNAPSSASLKSDLLATLAPYGDPALRVPASTRARVEELALALEARNPTRAPATGDVATLDGTWRVKYSDAPPPSNGALAGFGGEPYQIVDAASGQYTNALRFGPLDIRLDASFVPRGALPDPPYPPLPPPTPPYPPPTPP